MPASLQRDEWTPNLFRQTYVRSLVAGAIIALALAGLEYPAAAKGLLAGLVISVLSMASVELTVRILFRSGEMPGVKIAIAMILKYPALIGGLLFVAWGAQNGQLDIFAVVGGFLLVHLVLLLTMLSGRRHEPSNGSAG